MGCRSGFSAADGFGWALGSGKWGIGPTAVVLKQTNGSTVGALWNHIWSFAGNDTRQAVNATFFQPSVGYTTRKQTTYTINSESTYDWKNDQWTAPINLMVAQLVKVGGKPLQFQVGYRYYVEKPANGPNNGLRFSVSSSCIRDDFVQPVLHHSVVSKQ
jgi:hypothetical protein